MARKKFLRGEWRFYSKLGKRRKKKQKYRKAKGRHSKIREKMKGNPKRVEIGYKKAKKDKRKEIKIISNINELLKIKKGEKIILAKIGRKKRIEIARKSKEQGIKIANLNIEKFLEQEEEKSSFLERKTSEKQETKEEKDKKEETKTENVKKKESKEEKK